MSRLPIGSTLPTVGVVATQSELLEHEGETRLLASDPYEFIRTHETTLEASAQAWRGVAQRAEDIQTPELAKLLEPGIADICAHFSLPMPPVSIENEAVRITSAFAVYSLLAARYMSTHERPNSYSQRKAQQSKLFRIQNPLFSALVVHPASPVEDLMSEPIKEMYAGMRSADRHSSTILEALVEQYSGQPEGIVGFAELYQDGAVDVDRHFRELREIVAADWHGYDKSHSILRRYCATIFEDPREHLAEFSQYIAETMTNKRALAIKEMAKFAVAAAQRQGISLSVEEAIGSTYDDWGEFGEIESLFQAFIKEKKGQLEEAFATIAGPRNNRSIRLPRPISEVVSFKSSLGVHLGNRSKRRASTGSPSKRRGAISHLPDTAEITRTATAEVDKPALRIMIAKNTGGGTVHLTEATPDEAIERFSIGGGNGSLREDVKRMIGRLQEEPISRATKLLKSNSTITVREESGRRVKIPLRRFAPEASPGLGVSGANRYYRIVFAVNDGALILIKIMSHEDFDSEY